MAEFIIFGAGKIARGFIAHLLHLAGRGFAFVEADAALAGLLEERGEYTVSVFGAPEKNCAVRGFRTIRAGDAEALKREARGVTTIFTAVGGKNLPSVALSIAEVLKHAPGRPINVITCENWKQPADIVRDEVLRVLPECAAGFSEAVVMRSAVEPDEELARRDPLAVCVQDYWRLPVDAGRLAAPLPEIPGIEPIQNFAGFLEQKFYTYNAANGTVSYLGALLGHAYISDAARDSRIEPILRMVYNETGRALCAKHGIAPDDQAAFAGTSFAKLRDRIIVDTIERNARDPLRKLGPDDRLVGSARLALEYGAMPEGLACAIAAAVNYRHPGDPSAEELGRLYAREGIGGVLRTVCRILPGDGLYEMVIEKEKEMKAGGWIKT